MSGAGILTVNSGAVLSLGNTTAFGRGSNGIAGGTLAFGAQEAVFHTVYSDLTVASALTGSGGLTKTGDGALTLAGSVVGLTGPLSISSGILRPAVSDLGTPGALVISNRTGTFLDLTGMGTTSLGFSAAVGSLASGGVSSGGAVVGGQVLLGGANTLTAGADNTSTSYAGILSGNGNLAKTGTGTLTLTGANLYSGTTSVATGGTLRGGVNSFLPATTAATVDGTLNLNDFTVTLAGISGGSTGVVSNTSGSSRALTLGNSLGSWLLSSGLL